MYMLHNQTTHYFGWLKKICLATWFLSLLAALEDVKELISDPASHND